MSISDGVDPAPGETQVGMVALGLGHGADAVHEIQRCLEIGKQEGLLDMMPVDYLPLGKQRRQFVQSLAFERRYATAAGHATSIRQAAHPRSTHTSLSRTS